MNKVLEIINGNLKYLNPYFFSLDNNCENKYIIYTTQILHTFSNVPYNISKNNDNNQ